MDAMQTAFAFKRITLTASENVAGDLLNSSVRSVSFSAHMQTTVHGIAFYYIVESEILKNTQ
jgi:hypothetical protein